MADTTAANLLRDLHEWVHRTYAYHPKYPARVEVSAKALILLGHAAGWQSELQPSKALTVYGLPLDSNGGGGTGYVVFAVDGSVLAEGDVTGP